MFTSGQSIGAPSKGGGMGEGAFKYEGTNQHFERWSTVLQGDCAEERVSSRISWCEHCLKYILIHLFIYLFIYYFIYPVLITGN